MTPTMNRWGWVVSIAFWILFVASISLVGKYPWVDTVWIGMWALLGVVVVICSLTEMFRLGRSTGEYLYPRGAPPACGGLFSTMRATTGLLPYDQAKTESNNPSLPNRRPVPLANIKNLSSKISGSDVATRRLHK